MKLLTTLALLLFALTTSAQNKQLSILQLNIWQEGTIVPGGYDAIVAEIDRLNPDIVTLSEVRNYNNTRFCDRIVASLAAKGKQYYSFFSNGAGVMSRTPITDSSTVFEGQGEIYKLITKASGREIAVYSAHLDYLNYAVYLPRGYDGVTWKKLPAPVTNIDTIMASNLASKRDEAIAAFLKTAAADKKAGRLIFLGGDFNEASHLDWTSATSQLFDHHGVTANWTCSAMLYQQGFKDSFRELYPNPVTHPGFTFPADNTAVPVCKLAWAPDADERERIDFIYFYPDKKLKVLKSNVVGPAGSIIRNQRGKETGKDVFMEPVGVWPTDHKGLLTVFEVR
ncbi:endonuclease/exonuclease/phosphatase family protein [Chitinophaga sp. sic0106]|uniref:endonuclease/exonuclease/phosphatase family protein n=1 Tax=Chitinophaga sp. sic0106 TaxID=2854785 RepID=UPI001C45B379|nr:endonuclease/exonuclease/phosphatase family protein [Chitinophaga sp. sic0106]MBV7532982.1 endonuclease/exonuclease/phosphatase family protein [Chitinophaga sp. sic0106]